MKILFLQDRFPPVNWGGDGTVAFNLACSMQKLGYQVFIITTIREKSKAGRFNEHGLNIFRIKTDYNERWRAYLGLYNPETVKKAKEIIEEIKPDVTHIHTVHHYLSYCCLKIARKHSKKVFLTAHDVMLFHYGKLIEFIDYKNLSIPESFDYRINFWQQIKRFKKRYNPFRNIIIKHYLKYVDKIFAVSHSLRKALTENGIKNVETIYNGVDENQWQVNHDKMESFKDKYNLSDKKIVFYAGRLSNLKGGGKIIDAMKIVVKEFPEALLLVAGRKESYAEKMMDFTEKGNVKIVFTGWIENDDLVSAYHSSDVIVTPSIYMDPFNLINIEGMICKKPVVGTCFGGTAEIIIDKKTGYIVNPLDSQTMADRIIDLFKNPDRAKEFGLSGYERARQEFSLEKQTKKYLKEFKL